MEVHPGWNQLRRLNWLPASTGNQFAATFRHKAWNGVQNYCSNTVPKPKMGKCFHRCVFNQYVVGTPGRPFLVPTLWIYRGRRSLERLQGQRPQMPPCHCMEIHTTPAKGSWKREGQEGERRNWSPQERYHPWAGSLWNPSGLLGWSQGCEECKYCWSRLVCLLLTFIQMISLENIPGGVLA